jgi:hypothetical protein
MAEWSLCKNVIGLRAESVDGKHNGGKMNGNWWKRSQSD